MKREFKNTNKIKRDKGGMKQRVCLRERDINQIKSTQEWDLEAGS